MRLGLLALAAVQLVSLAPRPSFAISHGQTADNGTIGEPNVDLSVVSGDASESTGASVLSIPIDLPPGTNGHQPSLALSYSSDGGNGILGIGWSLPIPMISCSTRFGVPDYSSCPRYELSGQLLVGPDADGSYHTLTESFQKIEHSSLAPGGWVVTSPDGLIQEFGEGLSAQVRGPGGTAEWYLSSVTDVFGNRISYTYTNGGSGNQGVRALHTVSYAGNTRLVRFIYETTRPDPTYSFAGGVERVQTSRLREIRVLVNGAVHHRLMLGYETAIDTTQSRLVSIQRFGTDCDPGAHPVPTPGDCASLPAATFEYTDQGEVSRTERWEPQGTLDAYDGQPPWFPYESNFGSGGFFASGENMQVADVNGDGLPDLIADLPAASAQDPLDDPPILASVWNITVNYQASPQVFINNGTTGFDRPEWSNTADPNHPTGPMNESAEWTERLTSLRFDLPRHRVRQVENTQIYRQGWDDGPIPIFGTCLMPGESSPEVEFVEAAGSVQFAPAVQSAKAPYFDATSQRSHHPTEWQSNFGYPQPPPWDEPAYSEIRPWPQFYFTDLNADGLSDLVMSVYLSGYHMSLGACDSPTEDDPSAANWVEGERTRIVFINNGQGWDLDDGRDPSDGVIADSLPDFGIIALESADMFHREVLKDQSYRQLDENRGAMSACLNLGFGGNREWHEGIFSNSWDFCVGTFDLAPTFQDLNGDGYPDLIVTESADRDALFQNNYWKIGTSLPSAFRETRDPVSVAYLQNPQATGASGDPHWVRAPAYDPPYPHAQVIQFDGDVPGSVIVPNASAGTWGFANTHNVDKGVRFADFNRDGLPDMIFSPGGALLDEFSRAGGVFLNRGFAGDYAAAASRHGAWCSSSAVDGVATCADQASRYESPEKFADFMEVVVGDSPAGRASVSVIPPNRKVQFVDLNGDGWVDMLGENHQSFTEDIEYVYLHNPGKSGSVWVKDSAFKYKPSGGLLIRGTDNDLSSPKPAGYGMTDFNGDGIVDFIASERTFSDWRDDQNSYVSTTGGDRTDLLRSYDNGRGVVVEFEYASLIQQRDGTRESTALWHATWASDDGDASNDGLAEPPGPDPVWPSVNDVVHWPNKSVLARRIVTGPSIEPAETAFAYGHPRRCLETKNDLGFRLVEETGADLTRSTTLFFQKHGRVGVPSFSWIHDSVDMPLRAEYAFWELPDPVSVEGGWATGPGASGLDLAYIGRPESSTGANEYGSVMRQLQGSVSTTEWDYDDAHGYNFVSEVREDVPGRAIRIVSTPAPKDVSRNLMRRVAQTTVYRNEGTDTSLLSDTHFEYADQAGTDTRNKVGLTKRLEASRDGMGSSRWLWTYNRFDANGNLLETRQQENESASGLGRSTIYCYDGDAGCAVGHGSRSMIVGTRDALGNWSTSTPHPVFAAGASMQSDYLDVPNTRTGFDEHGRPTHQWFVPRDGSAHVLLSQTHYVDSPTSGIAYEPGSGGAEIHLPYTATTAYAEPGGVEGVSSIAVSDGFGGTYLSVSVLESMSSASTRGAGVQVTASPASGTVERTEPFACPAVTPGSSADFSSILESCDAVSEPSKTSTVWTRDGLGRTTRIDTPIGGVLVSDYGADTLSIDGASPVESVDRVLRKNALGGFREELLAGGSPVYIAECNQALQPNLTDISGVDCENADITRLTYDGTGELLERTDPTAIATTGTGPYRFGAEANQKLRYGLDTLGRIVQIDDPDAGVSTLSYDAYGQLEATIDARDIEVATEYDDLGRPERISVTNEAPTVFTYDADLLQVEEVRDGDLGKRFFYDEFGRIEIEIRSATGSPQLLSNYQYDLMGRTTRISYPVALDGIVETIGYDFSGPLLEAVCSLGMDTTEDCTSAWATEIVSDIDYDGIGRTTAMHTPGGVRNFTYDGNSGRRASDGHVSNLGSDENIEFVYGVLGPDGASTLPAYDSAGNLLRVDASIGAGSGSHAYEMEYRYDGRNRLSHWRYDEDKDGSLEEYPFGYDSRGNLTNHAGMIQGYASDETAHAIRTRLEGTTPWAYEYDAAGNLESKVRGANESHYTFDGRGRMTCVGSVAGGCDRLSVKYGGDGERREEMGATRYRYAGADFRLKPTSGSAQEYWIEVFAIGQRVAYKHVTGGAVRVVGLLPGWEMPPKVQRSLEFALCALAMMLLSLLARALARSPLPVRGALSMGVSFGVALLPVRVWAGGPPVNPHVGGTEIYRWIMADAIGSSLIEIDAAGQRVSHVAYKPFGEEAESSGSGVERSRRYYAGHDRQTDVGLVYMNARWMNPHSGTFLSVDPLVPDATDAQAYNGYSYARNNPVVNDDPTGMFNRGVGNGLGEVGAGGTIRGNTGNSYHEETTTKKTTLVLKGEDGSETVLAEKTETTTTRRLTPASNRVLSSSTASTLSTAQVDMESHPALDGKHFNRHQGAMQELQYQASELAEELDAVFVLLQVSLDRAFGASGPPMGGDPVDLVDSAIQNLNQIRAEGSDRASLIRRGEAIANQQDVVDGQIYDLMLHLNAMHQTSHKPTSALYINQFYDRLDALTPTRIKKLRGTE
ncbi:MAG: hypothetical protein NXI30_01415 [bacterium]|nr:hypothetical protein [bacterium]